MFKIIIGLCIVTASFFATLAIADQLSNASKTTVAAGDYVEIYTAGTSSKSNISWTALQDNMFVDTAIYSHAAGVGASKSLRISVDGQIYGF